MSYPPYFPFSTTIIPPPPYCSTYMSPPHTPRRSARLRSARHKFAPQNRGPEASTGTRNRFFYAVDTRGLKLKLQLYNDFGISKRTASYWLKQRKDLSSPSKRRTRLLSQKLGPKLKLDQGVFPTLLSASNPVRNQHYEA